MILSVLYTQYQPALQGLVSMASNEHLNLSEFIKNVHQQLRDDSKIMGSEKAWNEHIKNEKQLQQYATAMKQLAVNYWDNNINKNSKEMSRIAWVCDLCLDYFRKNKLQDYRHKEKSVAEKINLDIDINKQLSNYEDEHIRMLDVGSCYNAFGRYEHFHVIPIDIAPATSDVLKCDFLTVNVGSCTKMVSGELQMLQNNSFHIVVFSLFLEYLPTPEIRLSCCQKAYNLLLNEGLLFIITPDSKHVGANAKLMKSWQFLLAMLGFSRIRYQKLQHIHCMAFRKNLSNVTAVRWAELHQNKDFYKKMYIPQDFKIESTEPTASSNNFIKNDNHIYTLEDCFNFSDVDVNEFL